MPSGVLDANVTIGLAKGGVFHCLASLYSPLYISPNHLVSTHVRYPPAPKSRPGVRMLALPGSRIPAPARAEY